MRLIDADVLKAIYDPSSYEGHDPNENWDNVISTFEEIRADIDDQPTVDAVPVVRCKDCIHRRKGGFSRSETDGWTVTFTTPCDLGDEGFCSKGEKVTNNG